MLRNSVEFVKSLNLDEKFSPRKNVEIIWFYIFLPCVIAYFVLLTNNINSKPAIGSIETLDSSFNNLVYADKNMEVITGGLEWSEGPVWVDDEASSSSFLMFSDTKRNRVYKWEDGKGLFTVGKTIYLEQSGCKSNSTHCDLLSEPGSNGIVRPTKNSLNYFICQHGERAVALITESGQRIALATHYKGRRLNSPNDLVLSPEGHLYFTDPPYGLLDKQSPAAELGRELPHSGVYMLRAEHIRQAIETGAPSPHVVLLDDSLQRPNGLAFSPDFSRLYVSNSEEARPVWKSYEVADDGRLAQGSLFFDASDLLLAERQTCSAADGCTAGSSAAEGKAVGLPDGLKVDIFGNLFATGPGGVLVISPAGQLIGRLRLDDAHVASNVAFGGDGRLYITAGDIVVRLWVKTKPTRFVASSGSR